MVCGCLTLYGNKLFSTGGSYDDRTIRVWDADTHEHLATMEGHTGGVGVSHPLRQQALLCWFE